MTREELLKQWPGMTPEGKTKLTLDMTGMKIVGGMSATFEPIYEMTDAWLFVEWLRAHHFAVKIETNRFPEYPLVEIWANDDHQDLPGKWRRGHAGMGSRPNEAPESICLAACLALCDE